uniref:Uncharacterized protein n=1 Tax=Anguilla anguilla TaxID=7936 RepID=A0A0E9S313_ANGAN
MLKLLPKMKSQNVPVRENRRLNISIQLITLIHIHILSDH